MPGYNHFANCTCGWCCGGGGGGSRSTVRTAELPTAGTRSTWDCGDYCHPTRCPICGAYVFFVRYNGGSVWFDQLGKPWPKHACFDDDYYGGHLRDALTDQSGQNPLSVFGVVIETEVIEPGESGRIVVRCSNGMLVDDTFDTEWNLVHSVGALMIVYWTEGGAVSLRRISAHYSLIPSRRRPRLSVGVRITHDRRHYIWDGRKWYGAEDYTIAATGEQQRLNQHVERLLGPED